MTTINLGGLPAVLPEPAQSPHPTPAPTLGEPAAGTALLVENQVLQPLATIPTRPTSKTPGYLPATTSTVLWGRLPCQTDTAVVSVWPGQRLWIDTVSHEGIMPDQGSDPLEYFTSLGIPGDQVLSDAAEICRSVTRGPDDGPHVITGPIEVRGALPGDALIITVEALELRAPYGLVSNRHGRGALPETFPLDGAEAYSVLCQVDKHGMGTMPATTAPDAPLVTFPLKPFLGIMGVATATAERAHSVPPGAHCGNIDVSELGVGSSLHVPVQVDGALAYVGDPHFAQGDGEVALTAFEAPLRALLRFELVKADTTPPLPAWGETADLIIPFGIDPDLNEAMRTALRNALTHLEQRGMDPRHAYAYLSAAGNFAVSQVVDQTTGVHVKIRKADLAGL